MKIYEDIQKLYMSYMRRRFSPNYRASALRLRGHHLFVSFDKSPGSAFAFLSGFYSLSFQPLLLDFYSLTFRCLLLEFYSLTFLQVSIEDIRSPAAFSGLMVIKIRHWYETNEQEISDLTDVLPASQGAPSFLLRSTSSTRGCR